MEQLDDDCDNISIPIVKISDKNKALQFGLEETPAVLYFKRQIPGKKIVVRIRWAIIQVHDDKGYLRSLLEAVL